MVIFLESTNAKRMRSFKDKVFLHAEKQKSMWVKEIFEYDKARRIVGCPSPADGGLIFRRGSTNIF